MISCIIMLQDVKGVHTMMLNLSVVKRVLKAVYVVSVLMFIAWVSWSIVEVWIHNWTMLNETPYQYSSINLFKLFM
jgi:hypothetical protein